MCDEDKNIELVQIRSIPVPPAPLYEEALASGEFVGTFKQFLDKMKGPAGEDGSKYKLTEW